ncbi:tagaturonate reductase [Paenibacillus sp. UNC496MF]|uniref:tagaturonate reductase n=1 Tax=Paenibacillus sp. UNC496MF TaxID=1502753 RepID=UPI0008F45A2B|nr:tagaturonate reductase [Paenibacillus sp. UNC496MF]SFJ55516.1 tagaturonate reductase [Paenibacillus sp. UNC496MF]
MRRIHREILNDPDRQAYDAAQESPVTVLQIGEGNFLRGFFDWMIHRSREQGLFRGSIALTQPRPSGKAKIEKLAVQNGLYTLVTRGLENGERVERKEIISSFSRVFDPYSDWNQFAEIAESPSLRFVVSNTTEAGLVYTPEPLMEGTPVRSFPGKMTWLLYRRFKALGGAADSGLIFLPCELLERNGDTLRQCVLKYCQSWSLPDEFIQWVMDHNRFLNSLVDRIVTGYPSEQADAWFMEWGYEDAMLNTAEPYYFWAIEAEKELEAELPLQRAGLNIRWVDDLRPYQLRKVRILNGAHTLMTPLALLHGLKIVREVMEHPRLGTFIRETVANDIIPTIPLDAEELNRYADSVYERFLNPFIDHRLSDIAMNSLSKFKGRVLPAMLTYVENGEEIPDRIIEAFAALLRYYKIVKVNERFMGHKLNGSDYEVKDDNALLEPIARIWSHKLPLEETVFLLLSLKEVWAYDLSSVNELVYRVTRHILDMEVSVNE